MEKLRELMKEHQDKADKKVMGEVLELLQREPGLFVVTVHATKNFFLGAENGKAAAFLYTSREYADEFVKGLEMVGVETKVWRSAHYSVFPFSTTSTAAVSRQL